MIQNLFFWKLSLVYINFELFSRLSDTCEKKTYVDLRSCFLWVTKISGGSAEYLTHSSHDLNQNFLSLEPFCEQLKWHYKALQHMLFCSYKWLYISWATVLLERWTAKKKHTISKTLYITKWFRRVQVRFYFPPTGAIHFL